MLSAEFCIVDASRCPGKAAGGGIPAIIRGRPGSTRVIEALQKYKGFVFNPAVVFGIENRELNAAFYFKGGGVVDPEQFGDVDCTGLREPGKGTGSSQADARQKDKATLSSLCSPPFQFSP